MSPKTPIIELLGYCNGLYNRNLGGIEHSDSVRSLPGRGNTLNWIAGHIMASRDSFRRELGLEALTPPHLSELYKRGSANVTPENAAPLADIISEYNSAHKRLVKDIEYATIEEDSEQFSSLLVLCFHEAYHVGQLGLARRELGFEGTIK